MRKIKKIALSLALCILGLGFNAKAQDTRTDNHLINVVVPNVAILDLESSVSKTITATYVQPTPLEAGDKLSAPASNSDIWLNYSSIVTTTAGSTLRRVDVKASALVAGVDIAVTAAAATTGAGTRGTPTAAVTLTTADQPLVTGIGSAYTVTGPNNGHKLTYAFTALDANYGNLRVGTTAVTVTYTLVDY